jgi:hypothetical protein
MLVFFLLACDNTGGASSGTLTVSIAGAPSGADGKSLYIGMYEGGADPLTESIVGTGEILLSAGETVSDVIEESLTNETSFDPGDYDLYLWIDMNDNFDTVTAPEQGTDMSHISFPLSVTIDGDTTLNLASVGFELFPGFI